MALANISGDHIAVTTMWNEKDLMTQIPGARWDSNERMWRLPLTWAACLQLRGVFKDALTITDTLNEWAIGEIQRRVGPASYLRDRITPEEGDVCRTDGLFDYQQVGQQFLNVSQGAILGDEMGTGKTITALAAIRQLGSAGLPALIISPNGVKFNWEAECRRWFPEAFPVVINGSAVNKRKLLTGPARRSDALVIINIEAMRLHSRLAPYSSIALQRCRTCDPRRGKAGISEARCEVHPKELNKIQFRTVICDEAHRILDPKAKQTRAAWAVAHAPNVVNRWPMTGTPIANNPADVWSLLHFINPQEFPTRSKFIERYCVMSFDVDREVTALHPDHKAEFYQILNPRIRCIPKALVLDKLPPKLRSTRIVEMTPKQARAYEQMEQTMLTRVEDSETPFMAAASQLVMRARLLQLASSYVNVTPDPTDDEKFIVRLVEPCPKVDALLEIIEEAGTKQIAVCAESRQLIDLAAARLKKHGISHVTITGGVTQWERDKNLREFQAGKHRVMLFTVKAGGVGLTMTAADTIVFLGRSDSVIDNKQAEDRVHRIGSEQHESVHVIDIVTRGTVEENQIRILVEKLLRLDEITRHRKTLIDAGKDVSYLDAETDMILRLNLATNEQSNTVENNI